MGRAGFRGRFRGPVRYLFDVPVVPDPGGHRRRRFGLPRGAIGPESPQPISRGERDAIAGCAGFGPAGAAKTKTWRRCPRFACGCTRPADVSRTNASSPDVWRRQNVTAAVPHPSAVRVFQSLAPRFAASPPRSAQKARRENDAVRPRLCKCGLSFGLRNAGASGCRRAEL